MDVTCTTDAPGDLVIQENMWSGWYAQRDAISIPLETGPWLRVEAPAGIHHYAFRYRPWDVLLGIGLSILGVLVCLWHWFSMTISGFQPRNITQQGGEFAEARDV